MTFPTGGLGSRPNLAILQVDLGQVPEFLHSGLEYFGAKGDESVGNNCSYKKSKAFSQNVTANKPPPTIYRQDTHAQATVSKH